MITREDVQSWIARLDGGAVHDEELEPGGAAPGGAGRRRNRIPARRAKRRATGTLGPEARTSP